jgi:hypothetical protein
MTRINYTPVVLIGCMVIAVFELAFGVADALAQGSCIDAPYTACTTVYPAYDCTTQSGTVACNPDLSGNWICEYGQVVTPNGNSVMKCATAASGANACDPGVIKTQVNCGTQIANGCYYCYLNNIGVPQCSPTGANPTNIMVNPDAVKGGACPAGGGGG